MGLSPPARLIHRLTATLVAAHGAAAGPKKPTEFARATFEAWRGERFTVRAHGKSAEHVVTLTAVDAGRSCKHTEQFIVVFAHGYIIQTVRLMLGKAGLSLPALMKSVPYYTEHSMVENCSVTRVEMDAAGMRVHEEDFKILAEAHAFEGD